MPHISFPFFGGATSKILVTSKWGAQNYGRPLWHWPACFSLKDEIRIYGLDGLLLSMLDAAITGEEYEFKKHSFKYIKWAGAVKPNGSGVLLEEFPTSLIKNLNSLPAAEISNVVSRWILNEEFLSERGNPDAAISLEKTVLELKRLASIAKASNRSLFWWAAVP